MSLTKMATHILQFPPKHHIYIYTNAYQYIFFLFSVHRSDLLPGDDLFWGRPAQWRLTFVFMTALCAPPLNTVERNRKQCTTRHDLQGGEGGGLRTPQTNQMQAHKVRFGRGKGASHTCCATNGALSGDCWQRQLCPSGAKLDVTKTQLNLWDIQIVISMFLYLKCFFSNKKALFFNSASHISIY